MTEAMGRFAHGGDVYSHRGVVDFSANLNPLGMPTEVVDAVRANAASFDAYPDSECRALKSAIAAAEGVDAGSVVCTAGASDLIQRVCWTLRPAEALVTAPTFSGYEQALEQVGAHVSRHALFESEGFAVTKRLFDEPIFAPSDGQARPRLLFLCNPNNPTGVTIDDGLVERVVHAAVQAGVVVVVDECFLDFTEAPSAVPLCARFSNVVVMRAFTKLYAMAGLRLGYGICGDPDLVRALELAGQPWAVSTPAQVAGTAALGLERWTERTRECVARERARLMRGLESCGFSVVPGEANYLLFKSDRSLYEPLLEAGFLVRRCANYEGLGDEWYRIAVRTERENEAFLSALRGVCS